MRLVRILALCSLGCLVTAASAASTAQDAPGVIVAEVSELAFPLTVEALGTAVANESIEVRPKLSETVTAIRFDEGQAVAAGAVLVELRNTEALAQVAAARANLVETQSQYARAQELFRTRAVSASELEQLEARRDATRAALDAAEARLADAVVRAPFAGRVGLRRVSLGSLVTPQTVITTLDDTHLIKLDFAVPETVLARLAVGLTVIAHSAAYPDEVFRGDVTALDTRVDPVSRTIMVRATLPNPDARLRPGMFLTVQLLKQDVLALVIPEQAVIPEQSRQFVLVVGDGGVIEQREVRLGRRRPGQVEVLEGLVAGEVVVVEGTQKARPGETVRVVGTRELTP